jgi:hypothetical protein
MKSLLELCKKYGEVRIRYNDLVNALELRADNRAIDQHVKWCISSRDIEYEQVDGMALDYAIRKALANLDNSGK